MNQRHRKHSTCACTGRDGNNKRLYRNTREADEQIEHAKQERRVELRAYPCPRGPGYHLTSKTYSYW